MSNIQDTLTVPAIVCSGTISGTFSGPISGAGAGTWTGPLIGNVTGNVAGNASGVALAQQVLSVDSTITVIPGDITVTKGSVCNITLNAPTVGTDDGKLLFIFSETAFAHIITSAVGFNRKNSSGTATASAAANNSLILKARNGQWNVQANTGFTLA